MTRSQPISHTSQPPLVLGVELASSGSGSERTAPPRYLVSGSVERLGSAEAVWRSVDLSEGGAFIEGPLILPRNSVHDFQLSLPHSGGRVEFLCRARVAWINGPGRRTKPELPEGMGLQFVDLGSVTGQQLQVFLQGHERQRTRQGLGALERYLSEVKAMSAVTADPVPSGARPEPAPAPSLPSISGAVLELVDVLEREENPFTMERLDSGAVIGSYRIERLLGSGSMGDVYLARHRRLGKMVAVKRLRAEVSCDPNAVERFFHEAQKISQLNHPNIVEIIDFIEEADERCYVMEWLQGVSLGRWRGQGEAMTLDRALTVATQLCDALEVLHQHGIVHRDLKPDNVMLVERHGVPDVVKLLDFSVSKFVSRSTGESVLRTQTGMVLGTPGYLAPEQIVGMEIDHRADIYAFGVVLYQLLTGHKPFVAETWPELLFKHITQQPVTPSQALRAPLPPQLDALILQCMSKEPEARPQTVVEIRSRLMEIQARALSPFEPLPEHEDRSAAPQRVSTEHPGSDRYTPRSPLHLLGAGLVWLILLGLALALILQI